MPSAVNSSTLEIDYLISISITVQKLDSEGAEANFTCGQPTNILGSKDIVICEPMTNDLAGPRRFRTIHLKK